MRASEGKRLSSLKVAAVYIGTVVGAGFASGQEVLQFFVFYGAWGYAGVVVVTVLFAVFGYSILRLGAEVGARSHLEVIRRVGGLWLSHVMDGLITFFLFGALVVMAAGSGAIFVEQFGLPALLGSATMLLACLVTVLLGVEKVISAISFIVPILVAAVLAVTAGAILSEPGALAGNLGWSAVERAPVRHWAPAALLYVSYNLVLAVAVLAPLGALAGPGVLVKGAIMGALGLGVGVAAIFTAILTRVPAATGWEVPMLAIAGTVAPAVRLGYSIVLFSEVYSTAVASLYGFVARLRKETDRTFTFLSLGASLAAFLGAQVGFSTIVGTLFPLVGLGGLLLLGSLGWGFISVQLDRKGRFKGHRWFLRSQPFAKPDQPGRTRKRQSSRE